MFRSSFSRLLAGYLAIFVITLAALTAAITFIYQDFVFSEKRVSLARGAREVELQYESWIRGEIGQEGFFKAIDAIGAVMDSKIYVLDVDGEALIQYHAGAPGVAEGGSYIVDDLLNIMNGREVFRRQEYSAERDTFMVYHGAPLSVDGAPEGAILQYSPVERIFGGLFDIYIRVWGVGAVMGVIGVALIYFYSARTTKSLRELERAALRIAAGETVEDIAIPGSDELSHLITVFNEMKEKLEQIETMRRDFIAGVSHELRTPLTSILGFVQGMRDGLVAPEEHYAVLDIIQQETRRLINLTGEILDLVKMENEIGELFPERFRVIEALTFIIGSLNIKEKKPGLQVDMLCPEDLYITADTDRFRQIMLNLLSNAINYTPATGRISVEVARAGKWARITVIDTGIGIEPEDLPLVFERFFRADKSRHSDTGGSGLGLNIAKAMVELHGGAIGIDSTPGKGTRVWFTMPVGGA